MSTKRRWTKEEKEILVQAVKANPHNLYKAFRQVSVELDRSFRAVAHQWYRKVRHSSKCFITISSKKQMINGKNYKSGNSNSPVATIKTLWKKLKDLL